MRKLPRSCRVNDAVVPDSYIDEVMRKAFKRYVKNCEKESVCIYSIDSEEDYDKFKRMEIESIGRLEREDLDKDFVNWSEHLDLGYTYDDFYKIWVYANGGDIYEEVPIPGKLKDKGTFSPGIVDCESDEKKCIFFIENLHPETRILLYHGTDEKTARITVTSGLDFNVPPKAKYERYHEIILSTGKRYRRGGIYVSANFKTADSFGNCVLEFVKEAKHLVAPNWAIEASKHERKDVDEQFEKYHPNSFRPSVSDWLLSSGEPQALLKESLKPEEILFVHYKGERMPVEKFKEVDVLNRIQWGEEIKISELEKFDVSKGVYLGTDIEPSVVRKIGIDLPKPEKVYERSKGIHVTTDKEMARKRGKYIYFIVLDRDMTVKKDRDEKDGWLVQHWIRQKSVVRSMPSSQTCELTSEDYGLENGKRKTYFS